MPILVLMQMTSFWSTSKLPQSLSRVPQTLCSNECDAIVNQCWQSCMIGVLHSENWTRSLNSWRGRNSWKHQNQRMKSINLSKNRAIKWWGPFLINFFQDHIISVPEIQNLQVFWSLFRVHILYLLQYHPRQMNDIWLIVRMFTTFSMMIKLRQSSMMTTTMTMTTKMTMTTTMTTIASTQLSQRRWKYGTWLEVISDASSLAKWMNKAPNKRISRLLNSWTLLYDTSCKLFLQNTSIDQSALMIPYTPIILMGSVT